MGGLAQRIRPSRRLSARIVGVLVLAAALTMPGRAAAVDELEVLQVGWDGTVVPGTWSPVRVRVNGGTTDRTSRVELVLRARYPTGPQSRPVEYPVGAYGQDVSLPAGVAKEIGLWAPVDGNMAGTLRLTARGTVLAEQAVEFRSARTPTWPLIGVLAEAPTVARSVALVELPYQGLPIPLSVARLSAADIPPQAERLGALSALVVQGNAAVALTSEQRRGVQDWVAAGGHLVLAGGPEASRALAVLPSEALPLIVGGVDSAADLAPLTRWIGWRDPVAAAGPVARLATSLGTVLAGTAELPLVWRLGLGQGTVTVLAADPALEPLAGWSGTPALVQRALEPALPAIGEDEQARAMRLYARQRALRLLSAVDALPPEAFPGWQAVALVLGGFALLVGPLLHLLLWRTNRREWTWLAVPALAVAAAGVLYFLGIGRGGRDVLTNVVAYVRLAPDGGPAQQALAAGFFAPTHRELAVSVPGDLPVRASSRAAGADLPLGISSVYYGAVSSPYGVPPPMPPPAPPSVALTGPATVVDGEPPFHVIGGRETRVEFAGNEWAMRVVTLDRSLGAQAQGIVTSLGLEAGLVKGTVRNDTAYPLEDAAVAVGQSIAKVGSLAPGQTVPVVLDPTPVWNAYQGGPILSLRLFGRPTGGGPAAPAAGPGNVRGPGYPPGLYLGLEIPRDPEVQRRQRLLDLVTNVPRPGGSGQQLPFTFYGFMRAPIGGNAPTSGDHPTYYLTLLEQPLHLTLASGPFTMPAGLVPSELLMQRTSRSVGGGSNGTVTWLELNGGAATYEFRPPLPPDARAEVLVVSAQQVGPAVPVEQGRGAPPPPNLQPGPPEEGVFRVYNWQAAAWEPLPAGQEQVRLQPAALYLGADRPIRVQVTTLAEGAAQGSGERLVRFIAPQVSVEGRVGQ